MPCILTLLSLLVGCASGYEPKNDSDREDFLLLEDTNKAFNKTIYRKDQTNFGVEDYWATPKEIKEKGFGDCEDIAIAKYFHLVELGVKEDSLGITYVTSSRLNDAHMILAYYPSNNESPLILDSLHSTISTSSYRRELSPVFQFNETNLFMMDGDWTRKLNRNISPLRITKWKDLIDRHKKNN